MKKKFLSLKASIFILILLLMGAAAVAVRLAQREPSVLAFSEAMASIPSPLAKNAQPSLSVPTQLTKIGEDYFLVDCYRF